MTRKLHLLTLAILSLFTLATSIALPVANIDFPKRQASSVSLTTSSTTPITRSPTSSLTATSATTSSTPIPDSGDAIPAPDPGPSYYENEGASGESSAFIKVPLGAQIAIIICIVLVSFAGLVGCVMFYLHKRKQWEAAAVRRRTRNARSLILAKMRMEEEEKEKERAGKNRRGSESSVDSDGAAKGNSVKGTAGNKSGKPAAKKSVKVLVVDQDVERAQGRSGSARRAEGESRWFSGLRNNPK